MKIEALEGKWFVNMSNFPMWLKGDKTSPTFNYTLTKVGDNYILLDKVTYVKKGKEKSILGFDMPVNEALTEFVWRGKGILRILKSKWQIIHIDSNNQWAIIYFEKTLFTPKGYDVISRIRKLSTILEQDIKVKLDELGINLNNTF